MPARAIKGPLLSRDIGESHRAATPLELFFDLCFVVAVAQAVAGIAHYAVEGNISQGMLRFTLAFFAIWWAWMNFTWFASAFDSDDIAYRLAVLVQIAGNLTMAAGIPRLFEHNDWSVSLTGYVIMRLGLVELWLRAARNDSAVRRTAYKYAIGITTLQIGWVVRLVLPDSIGWALFVLFAFGELAIPVWAERPIMTTWHPGHIAERYGLFTMIVLGESILVATMSIQTAIDLGDDKMKLIKIAVGGLLIVFSMWWLYFDKPTDGSLRRFQLAQSKALRDSPFVFGYGHFFFLASAALVGAGLEIAVAFATHHAELTANKASAMIAVPVAAYIACIMTLRWTLRQCPKECVAGYSVAIVLVLSTTLFEEPVLPIGLIAAGLVAWNVWVGRLYAETQADPVIH